MKDWKEYRLGEMIQCNPQVKLEKGKSYNLIDIDSIEIGSRYVKGKELTEYDGQSGCHFQNGDTVMARITPCLENGKIAQVQCESQKGFGSTELFVFRGAENKTDTDYVFNLMSMQVIRNLAANSMTGASGRQRADLGFIKRIKWNFPPLPTQQKIASILSAYDNLIQNYKKQIEALQTAASELYKEWFVRFRFPGYQTTKFENGIPEGWKIERLTKLVGIKYGKDHSKLDDGNIPVYGSGGIMRYCNKALYDKETVLIPRKGSLNNIMYANRPLWTVDTMFYSIMLRKNFAKYLYYVLSKIDMESFNAGAALPSMTTEILSHFKIIVPDNKTLELFDNKIALIFTQIDNLQQQITNLTQQRDLLLPRLMSGKLEVE